jgi:hypothetical protein
MPVTEANTQVVSRLQREGWANLGGGHDKSKHDDRPGAFIVLPRHIWLRLENGSRLRSLNRPKPGRPIP